MLSGIYMSPSIFFPLFFFLILFLLTIFLVLKCFLDSEVTYKELHYHIQKKRDFPRFYYYYYLKNNIFNMLIEYGEENLLDTNITYY